MPWTVQFRQDTEAEAVGTATATYTDERGIVVLTYEARVDQKNSLSGFVEDARANLAKRLEEAVKRDVVALKIAEALNAESVKAGEVVVGR